MKCIYTLLLCLMITASFSQISIQKYESYIQDKTCKGENEMRCLELVDYVAIRSDGRQVKIRGVYNWRSEYNKQKLIDPHGLTEYIKLLRDAYVSSPEYGQQLYNQIDYLVSKAISRNGVLVWENNEGIAQGMEQVEYAALFASCANVFKSHNDVKSAKGIMSYALSFFCSLNLTAGIKTGGVISVGEDCGAKRARFRKGYWFHSRGLRITDAPGIRTVLNQHFHVIRDLLLLYINLKSSPELINPRFGTYQSVLDNIEDKAIGGLYQLAFSEGHKGISPNRPPNIRQFMNLKTGTVRPSENHPNGNPINYYWSYYEYNMKDGGGLNISHSKTCHYHTHVLNLIAGINNILERYKEIFLSTENGWRLFESLAAILDGKGESTGMVGSENAICQFYKSESDYIKKRRENCPDPDGQEHLDEDVLRFYKGLFD